MAYTITFDANGGTCATSTMSVESGVAIGDLPPPSRTDFLFIGWYKTEDYGWSLVMPESTFSEDTTVTARWIARAPQGDELSYYYPGANVASTTQGLGFQFNSDGTAYAYRFCNVGENTGPEYYNNSSVVGDVIIPYLVVNANDPNDETEYVVVAVGQDRALTSYSGSGISDYYNDNLTGITVPITVTQIMNLGLYHCRAISNLSLESIEVVENYGLLLSGGNITSLSMRSLCMDNRGISNIDSVLEVSLPSLTVGMSSLLGSFDTVTRINLPLLSTVRVSCFISCTNLETVSLPSANLLLGQDNIFYGCTSLRSVSLPRIMSQPGSGGAGLFRECTPNQIKIYFGDGCDVRGNYFLVTPAAICMKKGTTIKDDDGNTISYDASNPPTTIKLGGLTGIPLEWYDDTEEDLKFTISFDKQGGVGHMADVTASYGYAMPALSFVPLRVGYLFDGFYTDPDGLGLKYYNADGTSARDWDWLENKTLYAKWTASYAITLDKQDGVGGTDVVSPIYGEPMPPISVPTMAGHTFGGYFTQTAGGGDQYYTNFGTSARDWDKTDAETTLYAKWTANAYTVTLDQTGGSGGTGSVTVTYGSAMPTEDVTMPSRTGYAFGGYYSEPDGGGTQYYTALGASAGEWDVADNATLYAKWTAVTYTVTLDKQSGSGGTNSVTATYGQPLPDVTTHVEPPGLPVTMPTRDGYSFGGYFTETGGGGVQYYTSIGTSARTWDIASNNTPLYAYWIPTVYTVTVSPGYQGDGATTTTAEFSYSASSQDLTITLPTRTKYTVGGWAFMPTGGGSFDELPSVIGTTLTIPAGTATDFIVTPTWQSAVSYTVQFNGNASSIDGSVTGTMDPQTIQYASYTPLSANQYEAEGYYFKGWNTANDGTGASYSDGADGSWIDVSNGETVTLYAMWRKGVPPERKSRRSMRRGPSIGPTFDVPISPLPNQIISRMFRGISYDLHFRTFNGMMYVDISIDSEPLVYGVRCISNSWLSPNYATAEPGAGNFMFTTLGDAYPWYEDFGDTCKLGFYDADDYAAVMAEARIGRV